MPKLFTVVLNLRAAAMIKRQDYRLLHPSKDEASSSSSSEESSLSEKADSGDEVESFESADDQDSPEESSQPEPKQLPRESQWAEAFEETENERVRDSIEDSVVLRIGPNEGVLRCRLCPKTICLSDDTMRAHLGSNGHRRAVSRFAEGKLKVVLNSDGEEESADEGETHAERLSRIVAATQFVQQDPKEEVKKKQSGRQRQRFRAKKKAEAAAKRVGSTAAKTKLDVLPADICKRKPVRRDGSEVKNDKGAPVVATPDKGIDSIKRSREGRGTRGEKSKKRNKPIQD